MKKIEIESVQDVFLSLHCSFLSSTLDSFHKDIVFCLCFALLFISIRFFLFQSLTRIDSSLTSDILQENIILQSIYVCLVPLVLQGFFVLVFLDQCQVFRLKHRSIIWIRREWVRFVRSDALFIIILSVQIPHYSRIISIASTQWSTLVLLWSDQILSAE